MVEGDEGTYQGQGFTGTRPGAHSRQEALEPRLTQQPEPHTSIEHQATASQRTPPTVTSHILMQGKWRYLQGIPGWQPSPLGTEMRCDFTLTADSLEVTRHGASYSIPLSAMQGVAFDCRGNPFLGSYPRFFIRYTTPDGTAHTAQFEFPYLWDRTKTGTALLAHLNEIGIEGDRTIADAQQSSNGVPSTAPSVPSSQPRPGLFAPWYVKEPGPLVVKKYQDNWVERGNMNRDIREASAAGWQVAQTETVPGHLNAGWLVLMILFFWTVIIPLFALLNLRSTGKFVVTFQRAATPTAPEPQSAVPVDSQVAQTSADVVELLQQLRELRDKGLISEDEFETRRQAVLEQRFSGHS